MRHLSFPLLALCCFAALCLAFALSISAPMLIHVAAALFYLSAMVLLDRVMQSRLGRPALEIGDSLMIGCAAFAFGPLGPVQVILLASVSVLVWLGLRAVFLGVDARPSAFRALS